MSIFKAINRTLFGICKVIICLLKLIGTPFFIDCSISLDILEPILPYWGQVLSGNNQLLQKNLRDPTQIPYKLSVLKLFPNNI